MLYTRPRTKNGFLCKHDYIYDEHYDCNICPEGQILSYRATTREGYRQYASTPQLCKECPLLSVCTHSQNQTKMIHRHLCEGYLEEANHLRHTNENKKWYTMRKETIESVLAAINLKKLASWTMEGTMSSLSLQHISNKPHSN